MKIQIDITDMTAFCTIANTNYAFSLPCADDLAEQPDSIEAYESALARWIDDGHLCCDFDDNLRSYERVEMDLFIQMFGNNLQHSLKTLHDADLKTLTGLEVASLNEEKMQKFFPEAKICSPVHASGSFMNQHGEHQFLTLVNPDYARVMRSIYPNLY